MLVIRLQRVGRKNDPSFRVVLTESKNGPRSGKFLEILGSYDARKGQPQFNAERIKHWLSKGVKPSNTLNNLLVKNKVIAGTKINVSPARKAKEVVEEKPVETKAPVVEEAKVDEAPAEVPTEEKAEEAPVA